jgi:hypothetical protein
MNKMKSLAAIVASLAMVAATTAAWAITIKDPAADDALVVFSKTCLVTLGVPDKVAGKVAEFGAAKLSDQAALDLAHGKAGAHAWNLTTPHGAQLAITSTADQQCSVLIRRIDAAALQDGLLQVLDQLAQGGRMVFRPEHHDDRPTAGGIEDTSDYLLKMPHHLDATVSITTTTAKTADLQGLLTFTLLNKKN